MTTLRRVIVTRLFALPRYLGELTLRFIFELGALMLLVGESMRSLPGGLRRWRLTSYHIYNFGFTSQAVVILTGAFVGMVFAAQIFWQLKKVQMENAVGSIVAVAMFRELGPTIAALMIAGRVGASITAEIGTMRVTEQVDALRAMSVLPVDYLVVPRILAIMVCMPLLTAEAIAMGIGSSFLLSTQVLGIDPTWFWANTIKYVGIADIRTGLVKGFLFGLIIVFISCYKGLTCRDGAEGVGRATTSAVVISSMSIIIANFFITFMLNALFPTS